MNSLTPQQQKVIETWTEKRDTLLRDIGVYERELGEVRRLTKEGSLALSDIHKQIEFAKGRLTELDLLEERHKDSVSIEVAELEARKSRLEAECLEKENRVVSAENEQGRIATSISVLGEAHDKMADQAKIVNEVVGQIIETSRVHISETKTIMSEIRTVATQVIESGNKNIEQTNIVLGKLPRYIFELQKPIPLRRTYAVPRGSFIEPETPVEATEVKQP